MEERKQSNLPAGQDESKPASALDRRSFVRTATVGGAAAAALAAGGLSMPAFGDTKNGTHKVTSKSVPTLKDAGAGMHVGIGSVQMIACATISRELVTCQVGQMGLDFSQLSVLSGFLEPILGILLGPGFSGPFAMSMFSLNVSSYDVNHAAGTIRAKGVVRSITKIAGITIEDATSPYIATSSDGSRTGQRDAYSLNFTTPFWKTPGNPLATPSTVHPGWSMFGGELIVGEISVTK
ncbi:MAG TPA: hypothetical protein VGI74_07545 [Streptosporangiaceae bacterium]